MREYSVYIHLPFCRGRCPYCDFVSNDVEVVPSAAYRRAVEDEWLLRRAVVRGRPASLYVGGGTPSLLDAEELLALIEVFAPGEGAEVTVEVNPGDADEGWFAALVRGGVSRFSVGVQSLDDGRLTWLGRRHDSAGARRALGWALGSGARSVSADLIWGTPVEALSGIEQELRELCALGVDHVSAYELTVAQGTPLWRALRRGDVELPADDELAGRWELVGDVLAAEGLPRYEVSSHARPGKRCRHNEHYWRGGEYVGLGSGAHGFVVDGEGGYARYANTSALDDYLAASRELGAGLSRRGLGRGASSERLDPVLHARERVMLGLRTVEGLPLEELLEVLSAEEAERWRALAGELVGNGLAHLEGGVLAPTPAGMLRADGLAERFF